MDLIVIIIFVIFYFYGITSDRYSSSCRKTHGFLLSGTQNSGWVVTLETRDWRPPRGPSTRNRDAPSASSSTARLSTVLCDKDFRSRSVATSLTMPRKKSRSPRALNSSLFAERLAAGAHWGSLILDSISRDNMFMELGGSDVYLQGEVHWWDRYYGITLQVTRKYED